MGFQRLAEEVALDDVAAVVLQEGELVCGFPIDVKGAEVLLITPSADFFSLHKLSISAARPPLLIARR